jgi:hypothetical protein
MTDIYFVLPVVVTGSISHLSRYSKTKNHQSYDEEGGSELAQAIENMLVHSLIIIIDKVDIFLKLVVFLMVFRQAQYSSKSGYCTEWAVDCQGIITLFSPSRKG